MSNLAYLRIIKFDTIYENSIEIFKPEISSGIIENNTFKVDFWLFFSFKVFKKVFSIIKWKDKNFFDP